jgi:diguanylate cyclase (GGDEF)-like protein
MELDARTLLFALALLALLISLMAWLLGSTSSERDYGFKQWSMASASAGVAMVLIFLRGQIPEIFGIFLANVILLFSASACLATVSKFYETAFPVRRCMAVFAAGMAGLLLWLWGGFSLTVPTVTVCVALSAILFDACALIVKKSQRPFSFSVILLASTLGIMAAMYCFRAVVTVLAAQPTSGTIGNSASQLGVLIVGALFIVSSSIGFFVMVHEHQRNLIEALSRRDVLTGVLTRRAFFEDATRITQSSDAYAVLMIDIDHFKSINDSFGHLGGDKVLAHCARLLMNAMRIDDVLGRYGGEEFCAILPNCGLTDAEKIAQSIVQQIREQNVMLGEQQIAKFSLSIGVAAHQHAEDLLATIKHADEALYAAKNAGRDRVCVADTSRGI